MSSRVGVILKVRSQYTPQTPLVEDDHVIQAFPGVSTRSAARHRHSAMASAERKALPRFQVLCRFAKYLPVIAIAITQQKTRSRVPGEGLQ
jgi:hypothetical protein